VRTIWRDRAERPGWDIRYTVVGGRLSKDPVAQLDEGIAGSVTRALSQVMVASTPEVAEADPRIAFWASVVRKVVQRGTRPIIHHPDGWTLETVELATERLLGAISGPVSGSWALDQSVALHPRYEAPFWDLLTERAPHLRRWCMPQAWLEGLAGKPEARTQRWVDFLVYVPWLKNPSVIEIDGHGHERRPSADRERDRLLHSAGARVERIQGEDVSSGNHPLIQRLATGRRPPWLGTAEPSLLAAVHGPAALHRFAYALAEAVERGFLPVGRQWNISLSDDLGVVGRRANISLDLVSSLAEAWDLDIVPRRVSVNGEVWERASSGRFCVSEAPKPAKPAVHVDLAAFTPPHAELPNPPCPSVVMRGCLLPVDLAWTHATSIERRNRTGTERSLAALDRLATDLYGYADFREGQQPAISRILSGGDACVLLPTGAGKSLIYQMAGMLRPGVTLVIAPLRSLIDDQERRLRELGIDRVVGLHSGKGLSTAERAEIQRAIGYGESVVVLVAPERLQIAGFREQLQKAAGAHLVNLAVVDEAHCVSEWGHQFRTSYLKLGRNLRQLCKSLAGQSPPILALTATASPRVLNDLMWELGLEAAEPGVLHRPSTFDRPNLQYRSFPTTVAQREAVVSKTLEWIAAELGVPPSQLAETAGTHTLSGIVFVPHSKSGLDLGLDTYTEVVRRALGLEDDRVIARYAGKPPRESMPEDAWEKAKAEAADEFRSNVRPIMVSTNAFGMGIDKPNIRYTLHVTLPSSIEAFAQESGRAGRDGRHSLCALVAPREPQQSLGSIDRRRHGDFPYAKDDVEIQLNFLKQGFPDPVEEAEIASAIAEELTALGGPGSSVVISRSIKRHHRANNRAIDNDRKNEKALFRLLLIGVIDDYTIEYGSDTFTVRLSSFDEASLRAATSGFLKRASRSRSLQGQLDAIPSGPVNQVISRLLKLLIDTVFETIEPARALALREMLLLSQLEADGEGIRSRINAYLSEGAVASLLDKLVRNESDMIPTMEALEGTPPDELEWAGASTRYLESYPDNPLLLAVRALGEAWKRDGSREEFARIAADFASALSKFGLEAGETRQLTLWTLGLLRRYFDGERWAWAPDLWGALESAAVSEDILLAAEDEVLDLATTGMFHPDELGHVLARRSTRAVEMGARIVRHHERAA
jgi:ATP-dependent DNA helicase RecQ